jgi:hypothetical protein
MSDVGEIAQRASEPVQTRHHQMIAVPEPLRVEKAIETTCRGVVTTRSGSGICEGEVLVNFGTASLEEVDVFAICIF